jgi:hypothetical protein
MAVKAGGGGQMISVTATITGVEKTSEQFKLIRRDINAHMRDVMERVGDQELLPLIKADFPKLSTPTKYVQAGVMAGSLRTYRERSGVFIGTRLRGPKNRALGWVDFGGKRPRDTSTRSGTKVILRTIDSKRALIDTRVLQELDREFRAINDA